MKVVINIEKKYAHMIIVLLLVFMCMFGVYAAVDPNQPWHYASQLNIPNIDGIGNVQSGWYNDAINLAARFPGAAGDFYVQDSATTSTYVRVGAGVMGLRQYIGNAIFDNNVGIGTTAANIHLAIGDSDTGLKQQGDGELAVYTNNQQRMRFDSNGNVGIGTSNPSSKLDVAGDLEVNGEIALGSGNLKIFVAGDSSCNGEGVLLQCLGAECVCLKKAGIVHTKSLTPSGRYLGTYDDFRGGNYNGVSTQEAVNKICSLVGKTAVSPPSYQCVTSGSRNTEARHNGGWGYYDYTGQGWCTDLGVEWVECNP